METDIPISQQPAAKLVPEQSMVKNTPIPTNYDVILEELKAQVHAARMRAALAANSELVGLYLSIGRKILEQQRREGWGARVISKLADDLRAAFPDMKGFSPRNLLYMKQAAEIFGERPISQQVAAKLPWGHIMVLINKLKAENERLWYGLQAIEHGWSRAILTMQIESGLHERQATSLKISNFQDQLPAPQSDMAYAVLKDPYIFDFLSVGEKAQEREIERELVKHITEFLLELGSGFSYVGKQIHLEVAGEDFFLDLLFYHLKLRCYVVIELKAGPFKPEYAGKLNFYCSAVDNELRHEQDNPTIGLILCKNKNKLLAEYALRNITTPLAVSEYTLTRAIPEELKTSLPSVEEIEKELDTDKKE
ncbi:PDDEXK nuclease domain-containing protein [Bilophila wadsworthia]|uniref:PDDEXK nuclease domain-containing protein n=2 Tax=Bilophila wadsworthia TaxID=35833 RepID=UPI002433140A|nr:PDDEXK nuclease domain-containing protein [Bilophila wadsworthia]